MREPFEEGVAMGREAPEERSSAPPEEVELSEDESASSVVVLSLLL